jgi:hypothetical protein
VPNWGPGQIVLLSEVEQKMRCFTEADEILPGICEVNELVFAGQNSGSGPGELLLQRNLSRLG